MTIRDSTPPLGPSSAHSTPRDRADDSRSNFSPDRNLNTESMDNGALSLEHGIAQPRFGQPAFAPRMPPKAPRADLTNSPTSLNSSSSANRYAMFLQQSSPGSTTNIGNYLQQSTTPSQARPDASNAALPHVLQNVGKMSISDDKTAALGPKTDRDLKHVPCRFARIGACAAGDSCPFSHDNIQPGSAKPVCQYFLKGQGCKFGHKCALAHILPGQPPSMDRKNKKAAKDSLQRTRSAQLSGSEQSPEMADSARLPLPSFNASGTGSRSEQPNLTSSYGRPGQVDTGGFGSSLDTEEQSDTSSPLTNTRSQASPRVTLSPQVFPQPQRRSTDNLSPLGSIQHVPITRGFSATRTSPFRPDPLTLEAHQPSPTSMRSPMSVYEGPYTATTHSFSSASLQTPRSFNAMLPSQPQSASVSSMRMQGKKLSENSLGLIPSPESYPIPAQVVTTPTTFSTSPFSAPGSKSVFLSYSPAQGNFPISSSYNSSAFGHRLGESALELEEEEDRQDWTLDNSMSNSGAGEEFLPSSLNELLSPVERQRRVSRQTGIRPVVSLDAPPVLTVPQAKAMSLTLSANALSVGSKASSDILHSPGRPLASIWNGPSQDILRSAPPNIAYSSPKDSVHLTLDPPVSSIASSSKDYYKEQHLLRTSSPESMVFNVSKGTPHKDEPRAAIDADSEQGTRQALVREAIPRPDEDDLQFSMED